MRAVVDTNVLVSTVLSSGTPYRIYASWLSGEFEMVISPALVVELEDVLARPHISKRVRWSQSRMEGFFAAFQDRSMWVNPRQEIDRIKADPPDNRVLEAAVHGRADYIVTGDRHLLDLGQLEGTEIVTPAQFLAILVEARNS